MTERSTVTPAAVTQQPGEWKTFTATAYCPCEKCCGKWALKRPNGIVYTASGTVAKPGRTIAADWNILAPGTVVEIENLGKRIVEDKGGAIKGNRIDIYFGNHERALEYGIQQINVRIIKED